ncbi:hypothetical protein [Streptomyces lavendulocolor]|uniref:hypothetical protein n=1 Tax=Streptomyces lavendulocolor TaxID=67316 RepID=UPI003C2DB8F8
MVEPAASLRVPDGSFRPRLPAVAAVITSLITSVFTNAIDSDITVIRFRDFRHFLHFRRPSERS